MNKITAKEARELTNPSPLEYAYDKIRDAANNGKSAVRLCNKFWSEDAQENTIDWLDACLYLKEDGFEVNFFRSGEPDFYSNSGEYDAGTVVSW